MGWRKFFTSRSPRPIDILGSSQGEILISNSRTKGLIW
jgi:hypothetical protein